MCKFYSILETCYVGLEEPAVSTEEKELRELYVSSSSQAYETVAANSTILFLSEQIYTATDSDIYPQGPPPCVEFVEERASKQEGPPPLLSSSQTF